MEELAESVELTSSGLSSDIESDDDSEVPDLNALLMTEHLPPSDNSSISRSAVNGKLDSIGEKKSLSTLKDESLKQRSRPNLLSKSMLAKVRRKGGHGKREDPLERLQQYTDQQRAAHRKAIVVINIQDMGEQRKMDYKRHSEPEVSSNRLNSMIPSHGVTPRHSMVSHQSRDKSPLQEQIQQEKFQASQRITEAYEHVQKTLNRKREDKLSGIPSNAFQLMEPKGPQLTLIKEEKASVYNRRKRAAKKEKEGVEEPSKGSEKIQKQPSLPNGFVFPKEDNFIREKTKVEKIGLDWQVSAKGSEKDNVENRDMKSVSNGSFMSSHPPKQSHSSSGKNSSYKVTPSPSTIPGKLCRSSYPVTEALHKEGTSITKRKGKTLESGDMNVTKVWPRKLDAPTVTPIQMAYEDIRVPSDGFILKVSVGKHIGKL